LKGFEEGRIMSSLVATNIRLTEEALKELKYRAIEEKKSVNQLVREAIDLYLSVRRPDASAEDPFEKIIGSAHSGICDGSVKHDRYIYGRKR
jgi:predicted DNA-binding protein